MVGAWLTQQLAYNTVAQYLQNYVSCLCNVHICAVFIKRKWNAEALLNQPIYGGFVWTIWGCAFSFCSMETVHSILCKEWAIIYRNCNYPHSILINCMLALLRDFKWSGKEVLNKICCLRKLVPQTTRLPLKAGCSVFLPPSTIHFET